MFEKNENKQKEAGVGPLFKNMCCIRMPMAGFELCPLVSEAAILPAVSQQKHQYTKIKYTYLHTHSTLFRP